MTQASKNLPNWPVLALQNETFSVIFKQRVFSYNLFKIDILLITGKIRQRIGQKVCLFKAKMWEMSSRQCGWQHWIGWNSAPFISRDTSMKSIIICHVRRWKNKEIFYTEDAVSINHFRLKNVVLLSAFATPRCKIFVVSAVQQIEEKVLKFCILLSQ